MKHVNMKMVLGTLVSMIFLLGAIAAPVSALQTNIKIESYNQVYASGANNHTYMYVASDPLQLVSRGTMHLNEDLDYTAYNYDSGGWASPDSSLSEDTNVPFNWVSFNGWSTGTFGNPTTLPRFFDFEAADGSEFVLNTTLETRTFGLTFGQHTSVLAEAGYTYFGTLGISGQEFVHLTIESKQDGISWNVYIYDSEGRYITGYSGVDGDIWTIPFKPSGSGRHYVILQASPSSGTFGLFDLMPVAVTPQTIAAGGVVSGVLPSSQLVIDKDTGSFVYKETAPTVNTYKVNSPNDVASIAYAFNYPVGTIGPPQPVSIRFTSKDFNYGYNGGSRYFDSYGSPNTGVYYFRGGPYYVTVTGGDNTEYTLYFKTSGYGGLPINREFQFENYMGATEPRGYKLDVEEPSVLRVNSTATGGELSIRLVGVYEDGHRVARSLNFGTNLQTSNEYYLPAGDYFVEMDISNNVNEWVEFNIGPIVSETTTNIVDVGGFFVNTAYFQMYNMTLFLNNQDNVTVNLQIAVYDASGAYRYSDTSTLANWWDGSQILPHSTYWNNDSYNIGGQSWYDSYAFVTICAYSVANNTGGSPNYYQDYPVDLTIQWTNRFADYYDYIELLDVATEAASHNFTLPLPGSSGEMYALLLNTTPGIWYNVSVMTADVSDVNAGLFSAFDGRVHYIPWSDLNDEYVGTLADFSIQFGAISDQSLLELDVVRDLSIDGFLWIQITPMVTHQLDVKAVTPPAPNILGLLGGVAIPLVVGAGVIVVVYFVYVKRFKK
jgi:hypothetical protein